LPLELFWGNARTGVVDANLDDHDRWDFGDDVLIHALEQVGDLVTAGGDRVHFHALVLERLPHEGDVPLALRDVGVLDRQRRQRVAEEDDLVALLQLDGHPGRVLIGGAHVGDGQPEGRPRQQTNRNQHDTSHGLLLLILPVSSPGSDRAPTLAGCVEQQADASLILWLPSEWLYGWR
jgi:hypothetical protein